jgi:predicted pyridoxine 5'-phosphate oxidase superfamily flavin-nucleotide-binding protein
MAAKFMEVATTPAVRAAQQHYYGGGPKVAPETAGERTPLGPEEVAFITERDSFYLATVSETGWPYLQHRGGPPGFLRVLDEHTLAFADLKGNRQLLSTGNLSGGNDRTALFLMDYPQRTRLKIIGHARVLDAGEEPELARRVAPDDVLLARTERVFVVDVVSFDWNCAQYITPRHTMEDIELHVAAPLRARIAELEARLGVGNVKNSG